MSGRLAAFAVVTVAVLGVAAFGDTDGDIVWPTYSQVVHPGDSDLSCPAVKVEMAHVGDDIKMMDKARGRVQDNQRAAFDLERYRSHRSMGQNMFTGNGGGEEVYAKALKDITASKHVALDRLNHLGNLLLICKP